MYLSREKILGEGEYRQVQNWPDTELNEMTVCLTEHFREKLGGPQYLLRIKSICLHEDINERWNRKEIVLNVL